jgi:AraC-like DNA-binding protein
MKPHKEINIIKDIAKELGPNCNGIADYILLYDNTNNINPLEKVFQMSVFKVEQMILLLITDGHINMTINGQDVSLSKLNYAYISPDSIISIKKVSTDLKYHLFVMYPQILKETFEDLGINLNLTFLSHTFTYSKCEESGLEYKISIYNELKEELESPKYKHLKLFVRSYANLIIIDYIDILNINTNKSSNKTSRQVNVFDNFMSLLNEYCTEKREVQFYASKLGITPKYLSAVTIEYSGKNASSWIDEYVITKAKNLLREQQYNIKEVSEILNFPSQSFFGRYFKRITGMSPKQFISEQQTA